MRWLERTAAVSVPSTTPTSPSSSFLSAPRPCRRRGPARMTRHLVEVQRYVAPSASADDLVILQDRLQGCRARDFDGGDSTRPRSTRAVALRMRDVLRRGAAGQNRKPRCMSCIGPIVSSENYQANPLLPTRLIRWVSYLLLGGKGGQRALVWAILGPSRLPWLVLKFVNAELLVAAQGAAALKIAHHRGFKFCWIKSQKSSSCGREDRPHSCPARREREDRLSRYRDRAQDKSPPVCPNGQLHWPKHSVAKCLWLPQPLDAEGQQMDLVLGFASSPSFKAAIARSRRAPCCASALHSLGFQEESG